MTLDGCGKPGGYLRFSAPVTILLLREGAVFANFSSRELPGLVAPEL